MSFDTLILNGTIVDGTNTTRYKADLGLTDRHITAIGSLGHAEAARRIDATGHVFRTHGLHTCCNCPLKSRLLAVM